MAMLQANVTSYTVHVLLWLLWWVRKLSIVSYIKYSKQVEFLQTGWTQIWWLSHWAFAFTSSVVQQQEYTNI